MSTLTANRPPRTARTSGASFDQERPGLDLSELVFLASAFVAPVNLLLVAGLSVYDVLTLAVAFLLLAGRRRLVLLPRGLTVAALVFVAAALVSTFRATQPIEALTQLAQYVFIFAIQIPVVLTMVRSRAMLHRTLVMFVAGSLLVVVQAMAAPRAQGADRALSIISDNPNRLGYPTAYLLPFVLVFLVALWRSGRRGLTLLLVPVATYLLLWPVAASASRGATVATLVAALVYLVLRPGVGVRRALTRLGLIALLVWGAGWLVLNTDWFPSTLRERVQATVDPSSDPEKRTTLVGDREMLARAGLRAFTESPLVGTGLDNFRYVAITYEPAATNQVPHNLWIQLLAQVGLVGALAFAWFCAWWFVRMVGAARRLGRRSRDGPVLWACVASMAAVMTILMTIPSMNQRHYWLLYALGMAVLAATPGHHRPHRGVAAPSTRNTHVLLGGTRR